jgi:hypothetical protein
VPPQGLFFGGKAVFGGQAEINPPIKVESYTSLTGRSKYQSRNIAVFENKNHTMFGDSIIMTLNSAARFI